MDYKTTMEKAIKQSINFEKIELSTGTMPLSLCSPVVILETAMSAIECGITIEDFDTVAEGQAMLYDVLRKIKVR